jgi:hypothetical protein
MAQFYGMVPVTITVTGGRSDGMTAGWINNDPPGFSTDAALIKPFTPAEMTDFLTLNFNAPANSFVTGNLRYEFDHSSPVFYIFDDSAFPFPIVDGPFSFNGLPAGFTPTSAGIVFDGNPSAMSCESNFVGVASLLVDNFVVSSGTTPPLGGDAFLSYQYPFPATQLLDLVNNPIDLRWVGTTTWGGPEPVVGAATFIPAFGGSGWIINGNFIIAASWWYNATLDQYVQAGSSPGPDWVEVPEPTVTVLAVYPNQGLDTGAQPVAVDGSGFSNGATVTFDGVSATSVNVQNQHQLTCSTPAFGGVLGATADFVIDGEDPAHSGETVKAKKKAVDVTVTDG